MSPTPPVYVFTPAPLTTLPIVGQHELFPVHRVYCVGQNYLDHVKEMGNDGREPPFFFQKPVDSIVPRGGDIPYPPLTNDFHHEVELVVALDKGGQFMSETEGLACVFGYGVGIDFTRRDLQKIAKEKRQPWEIGKAFDKAAPMSALTPIKSCGQLREGFIRLAVNGEIKQNGDIKQMIWNVPEIIAKLSEQVELKPGDIIMTGTPSGVGAVKTADVVEASIEKLERLVVTIR